MGVFAKAKKARGSGGPRSYFVEGDYVLSITKTEFKDTRKDLKIWAPEFKVFDFVPTEGSPEIPPSEGSYCNWATLSSSDMFWPNIKAYTVALAGEDDEDSFDEAVSEDAYEAFCEAITGVDQASTGWHIKAQCRGTEGDDGVTRVFPRWIPVPFDEQPEAVQAAIKEVLGSLVA